MKNLSKSTFAMLLSLIVVATSCYYDNEEYLYPSSNSILECDTMAVSYALHIAPIISSKCMTCHSASAAPNSGGNVVLEGYVNTQKVAVSGELLGVVSHTPGYSPMPKGANKLSYCEITSIRRWVEGNSKNN